MESFDFGALLQKNEKKHKCKPAQFSSVAGGVQRRLVTHIKNRKSVRSTTFDRTRDLQSHFSPVKTDALLKADHRRQQLEKWKAEKEKKKKETAAQKKKPFVAGVPHAPLNFRPPPLMPSTSGRVTRSQAKANPIPTPITTQKRPKSFAPKDAQFRPPNLKNLPTLSLLVSKKKVSTITFNPVLTNQTTKKKISAANTRQSAKDTKFVKNKPQIEPRISSKVAKTAPVPRFPRKCNQQSNTLISDVESAKPIRRVQTPGPLKPTKTRTIPAISLQFTSSSDEKSSDSEIDKKRKTRTLRTSASSSDKLSSESQSSFEGKESQTDAKNSPVHPKNTPKRSVLTPRSSVPKSESGSEEKLRSPKSPVELLLTPEQMEMAKSSPCVTMSRGKDNARKEIKWKMNEGLLDDDASDASDVDHFRWQLAAETKRILEVCDSWDQVLEQQDLPETVQECILAAVGQGRLLVSQKMQQFASLIERAARPDVATGALVTPADLHGFWDMIYMQVENVDMRFKKLDALRARGWAEDAPAAAQRKTTARTNARKTVKPAATSRIRDMIAAARRAKKDSCVVQTGSLADETEAETAATLDPEEAPSVAVNLEVCEGTSDEKTFDAGFFRVCSPVRPAPAPLTPVRQTSLLKAVLSSEAKKSASKQSASFAMLRASLLSKHVECDGVGLLPQTPVVTPINLYATPGRSILKPANVTSAKRSAKKSIKIVLFNESDSGNSTSPGSMETARDFTGINGTTVEGLEDLETLNEDFNISSMDTDRSQRNPLIRQNAINISPILTRSRRKSTQNTPKDAEVKERRRSVRNNKVSGDNLGDEVPKQNTTATEVKERRRSVRNNVADDTEVAKKTNTPKVGAAEVNERRRSVRNNKVADLEPEEVVRKSTNRTRNYALLQFSPIKVQRKSRRNIPSATEDKEKNIEENRRSSRKNVLEEIEVNVMEEELSVPTPKRSARNRKSVDHKM